GKPETFTFLGFIFICSKTRRGKFQIKRKSRRDRMRVKLQAIKQELRRRMHQPIPEQGKWLKQVVTGYFNYHAVPTNGPTLTAFRFHVTNLWRRTLRRRSQKDWTIWERAARLANDWLPKPRILHPWPDARFAVRHPRWEPYARIGAVCTHRGCLRNEEPPGKEGRAGLDPGFIVTSASQIISLTLEVIGAPTSRRSDRLRQQPTVNADSITTVTPRRNSQSPDGCPGSANTPASSD